MSTPLAVILGAGPGIGFATAQRFHQEGFRVALVSRPGDPLPAFAEALPGSHVQGADLAREEELRGALEAIRLRGGFPEVLVYNASAGAAVPLAELDPAQVMADLQVNVASALAGVRWALPAMTEAGRGTLLFTGGGIGLKPQGGLASGSLGKAALRSLALSCAGELEPLGIHAATLTIRGFVQAGTPLDPGRIAQAFWELHVQPAGTWDRERVLP